MYLHFCNKYHLTLRYNCLVIGAILRLKLTYMIEYTVLQIL